MNFKICLFLRMAPDSSDGCATCEWLTLQSFTRTWRTRTWLRYVRVFAIAIPSVVCLSSVCL